MGEHDPVVTPDTARGGGTVFRGRYEHTIDPKGRLSIPARYRDELAARGVTTLVLSEGDHCVWAYPLDEWERSRRGCASSRRSLPERRNVVRVMVASAKECPVDRAGRTLVPPELREFAGLKKDVMIAGALGAGSRSGAAIAGPTTARRCAAASTTMTRKLAEHGA